MKIVFLGTPEFAIPSLQILIENGYDVVGVVTSTDKYGGRGKKILLQSAIKKFTQDAGIPVLQPPNLKRESFVNELRALKADLQVIVAFRMLPEVVWSMPRLGTMNLHASLLPMYRGAAPINWAIMNGDKETGLSTFLLQHEIDTGDILNQYKLTIGADETAGELHDRMMSKGAKLVLKSVQALEKDELEAIPQNTNISSPAPKLTSANTKIDWSKTAQEVHNHIRGLSPFPVAWTKLLGKRCKIHRSLIGTEDFCGDALFQKDKRLYHVCGFGCIEILEIQMESKRRMSADDFLRGRSDIPEI